MSIYKLLNVTTTIFAILLDMLIKMCLCLLLSGLFLRLIGASMQLSGEFFLNSFQTKFNNSVANARRFNPSINGSLRSSNQEMNSIRVELDVTKKVKNISIIKDVCSRCQGTRCNSYFCFFRTIFHIVLFLPRVSREIF